MNVDYLHSSLKENGCCAAIFARPSLVFPRKGACLPLFIPLLNPLGWTERSVRFCIKRTVCAILPLLLHALMELIVARVAMPGLVCCHKTGIERSRFNLRERIVEFDRSASCRLLHLPRHMNKNASLTLISLTSSSDSSSCSSSGACSSPYVRKKRCQIHFTRIFAIIPSTRTTFPVALHLAKLPTNPVPTNRRVPTFSRPTCPRLFLAPPFQLLLLLRLRWAYVGRPCECPGALVHASSTSSCWSEGALPSFFPFHSPYAPSVFLARWFPRIRTCSSSSGTGFSSAEAAASASQSDNRAPIASNRNRVRNPRNPLVHRFHPSTRSIPCPHGLFFSTSVTVHAVLSGSVHSRSTRSFTYCITHGPIGPRVFGWKGARDVV